MNIQTETLISVLKNFEVTQRAKIQSPGDYYEGCAETLKLVYSSIIPALENEMQDVIEETEQKCPSIDEMENHFNRCFQKLTGDDNGL